MCSQTSNMQLECALINDSKGRTLAVTLKSVLATSKLHSPLARLATLKNAEHEVEPPQWGTAD